MVGRAGDNSNQSKAKLNSEAAAAAAVKEKATSSMWSKAYTVYANKKVKL